MALTLRPTGLAFASDESRKDYTVCSGEWSVGLIFFEVRDPSNDPRNWFWSLHGMPSKPADMRAHGTALSLDSALDELKIHWAKWLIWANLQESLSK
jgi:hypothetical protein